MLKSALTAIFLTLAVLQVGATSKADCGSSPQKGCVKFLDDTHGFCFWYPPSYTRDTRLHKQAFPKGGQLLATLVSSRPRKAFSDDKEPGAVQVCLLPGVFDLQKLIPDAPTGYDTPPRPKPFGANVFYYYGSGGGGVAYPDVYYFNLDGRALRIVFDGPYSGDSKSPSDEMQAIETVMLSSFRAPR